MPDPPPVTTKTPPAADMAAELAANKGERTRQRIKDAFAELLAEKNFAALTIADICRKSDITVGGFYFHFAGQEELLDEVMNEYSQALWADVDVAMAVAGSADPAVAVCATFVGAYEHKNGLARAFQQLTRMRSDYAQRWRAASGPRIERLADILRGERPDLAREKAHLLAHVLMTMIVSQLDLVYVFAGRGRSGRGRDIVAGLVETWGRMVAAAGALA